MAEDLERTKGFSQGILFYDGQCALCNSTVLFVLRRDPIARFSHLHGTLGKSTVPDGVPDTRVVQTHEGSFLIRSDAWIHILRKLSGPWKVIAWMPAPIPRPVRDGSYRIVAPISGRSSPRPQAAPLSPLICETGSTPKCLNA